MIRMCFLLSTSFDSDTTQVCFDSFCTADDCNKFDAINSKSRKWYSVWPTVEDIIDQADKLFTAALKPSDCLHQLLPLWCKFYGRVMRKNGQNNKLPRGVVMKVYKDSFAVWCSDIFVHTLILVLVFIQARLHSFSSNFYFLKLFSVSTFSRKYGKHIESWISEIIQHIQ